MCSRLCECKENGNLCLPSDYNVCGKLFNDGDIVIMAESAEKNHSAYVCQELRLCACASACSCRCESDILGGGWLQEEQTEEGMNPKNRRMELWGKQGVCLCKYKKKDGLWVIVSNIKMWKLFWLDSLSCGTNLPMCYLLVQILTSVKLDGLKSF